MLFCGRAWNHPHLQPSQTFFVSSRPFAARTCWGRWLSQSIHLTPDISPGCDLAVVGDPNRRPSLGTERGLMNRVVLQDVIGGSDPTAALQLSDLTKGVYSFRLQVAASQGPRTRALPPWRCGQARSRLLRPGHP